MTLRHWLRSGCASIALSVGLHRTDSIALHPKPKRRRRHKSRRPS